jgi:carboxyl-terminal processing protease
MLEELWDAGKEKNIDPDAESITFIANHAKKHLKALMARDLWGSSEFYSILNSDDDAIKAALQVLHNDEKFSAIVHNKQ